MPMSREKTAGTKSAEAPEADTGNEDVGQCYAIA